MNTNLKNIATVVIVSVMAFVLGFIIGEFRGEEKAIRAISQKPLRPVKLEKSDAEMPPRKFKAGDIVTLKAVLHCGHVHEYVIMNDRWKVLIRRYLVRSDGQIVFETESRYEDELELLKKE